MYGGLGLWDINADCLGLKIYIMRVHWKSIDTLGQMIKQAFDTFVIDLGFGGDMFTANYNECHKIAERSWFSHIWKLCHHFGVRLLWDKKNHIQTVCKKDICFMDTVIAIYIFDIGQLRVIDRTSRFERVTLVSCTTLCDGLTINSEILTGEEGRSRNLVPHKEPHRKGIRLGQMAVKSLASDNGKLPIPLGRYKKEPRQDSGWHSSENRPELYKHVNGNLYEVFQVMNTGRRTHQDIVYHNTKEFKEDYCPEIYVSVTSSGNGTVRLHSTAVKPAPTQCPTTLHEVLNSWPNKVPWRHFTCSGDGSWMREGFMQGSLILNHGGSYEKVDTDACSTAYTILCKTTGKEATRSVVERSDMSDNY